MADNRLFSSKFKPDDADIVAEVGLRLAMELPSECIPGIVLNVELIKRHIDILAGSE